MNDFSQDFFQNLEPALLEAIRQTKNTVQKKAYMLDIPSLINELGTELREGTYQPSRFSCFVVKEPKIREIFAPHYRDRVVHHILVDRVEPFIDKRFIFDSFANRDGKGIHSALNRLKTFIRRPETDYYLQMDIKNFFPSIDKPVLFDIFSTHLNI